MRDIILVVTPARNGAEYLDETILSIVQQRGDFEIYYHLQDGGSSDSTLEIVRSWAERLRAAGGRFHGGAPVQVSWESATDSSMYEAIHAGFEFLFRKIGPIESRRVMMTWINADDVFCAGAFRTATSFLVENPDRPWVTGIPAMIIDDGTIIDVREAPYAYCRYHLALGRYDGRSRPFFQQEGTFWTSSLWFAVGGLNRRLRLAGDWDLWRRMAKVTGVVTLRAVLAHHRRRPGQLSAEMRRYWTEVDALKVLDEGQAGDPLDDGDVGWVGAWNPESGRWITYSVNMRGTQEMLNPTDAENDLSMRVGFADPAMPSWIRDVSGLSGAEEWGRWSDATLAPSVRICSIRPLPPKIVLRLRLAVMDPHCNPLVVTIGPQRFEIAASVEAHEYSLSVDLDAPADVIDIRPRISLCPREKGWGNDSRRLGVALHALEIARRL